MRRTEDGHENTFTSSPVSSLLELISVQLPSQRLSPILLTFLLRPLMAKSEATRVVFTTSEVHAWADPSGIVKASKVGSIIATMDDEKIYINPKRYTQSKVSPTTLVAGQHR